MPGLIMTSGWQHAKNYLDLQPDIGGIQSFFPGKILEYIDPKSLRWPSDSISYYLTHQAIEKEAMQENEYDTFPGDIYDFTLRLYLPRIPGAIEPFSMLL